ncbi:MAG: hypothetical protein G01um10143_225 [Parcubacteria group bacterium Gr01-1014_3]|nr:MAG: hypothetical protein G01um10143_225 [Parcubacteria group bacterium Gr01-1014_3]
MVKIKVVCWTTTLDQVVARLEECGFIKLDVGGPIKGMMMVRGSASQAAIEMLVGLGGKGIIINWVFDE